MQNTLDSVFRWMKVLAAGAGLAIVALVLLGSMVWLDARDRDAQADRDRIERSVESCRQYNKDQTNDRASFIGSIREMAIDFFGKTPEEADAIVAGEGGMAYVDFIERTNPYRQCSVFCVTAFFDPAMGDCPPALNEQGDSP